MSSGRGAAGAIRVVRHQSIVASPWRNGRGVTRELLRGPDIDGAPAWRISIAEIVQDGPFSSFPATDRHIAVVRGAGFELNFGDAFEPAQARLERDCAPFSFAGERPCICRLLDGPVEALNVMAKRHIATPTVEIVSLTAATQPVAWPVRDETERMQRMFIVVALDDGLVVRAAGVAGALDRGDALYADDPDAMRLELAPVAGTPRVARILIERSG